MIELIIMTLCFGIMASYAGYYIALLSFLLMQGCGSNLRNLLNAGFNKVIPSDQRATILSSASFVSRVGMILSLGAIHFLAPHLSVNQIYFFSLAGCIVAIPIYFNWYRNLGELVDNM
jgi:hypothetical protein